MPVIFSLTVVHHINLKAGLLINEQTISSDLSIFVLLLCIHLSIGNTYLLNMSESISFVCCCKFEDKIMSCLIDISVLNQINRAVRFILHISV
jgi:hypothetical protein